MNLIALLFIGGGLLIAVGLLVDWYYKRHGIIIDPVENEKHVSQSERTNVENMLREIKDQNNQNGW